MLDFMTSPKNLSYKSSRPMRVQVFSSQRAAEAFTLAITTLGTYACIAWFKYNDSRP